MIGQLSLEGVDLILHAQDVRVLIPEPQAEIEEGLPELDDLRRDAVRIPLGARPARLRDLLHQGVAPVHRPDLRVAVEL